MATEMWAVATAAVLLAAAAGFSAAALAGKGRPWLPLSATARGGSIVALGVALYLATTGRGGWSPLDLWQVTVSLSLATVAAHLALSWALGAGAGVPIADAVAAVLAVMAWLAIRPGGEDLGCIQRALPYRAEWILFLAGSGAALVAGSAGLAAVLPWHLAGVGARRLLAGGGFLAILAVGAGAVAGLWWTWQSTGTLQAADARESWMAVVWLLAAMSVAGWQLERGADRWAAGLALVAGSAAILGLLALPDLQRLMGL